MNAVSDAPMVMLSMRKQGHRRRILHIIGWFLALLLILLAITALWVWSNRYTLLENIAEDIFASEGVKADLSIDYIDRNQAVLKNISLIANGEPFFEAEMITAHYNWRDALNGQMTKLILDGPKITTKLDAHGNIIEGWIPPNNSTDNQKEKFKAPPDGIIIRGGEIDLKSPYGQALGALEGYFYSNDEFQADVALKSAAVKFEGLQADITGNFTIKQSEGRLNIPSVLNVRHINHPRLDGTDVVLTTSLNIAFTEDSFDIKGPVSAHFDTLKSDSFMGQNGQVQWDGALVLSRSGFELNKAFGDWEVHARTLAIINPDLQADLAQKLTLSEILKATPITDGFSPSLTRSLHKIIGGSAITGAGKIDYDQQDLNIYLISPVQFTAEPSLIIYPDKTDAPAFVFEVDTRKAQMNFNLDITGQQALSLSDMRLSVQSDNRFRFIGVDQFSARARSYETWTARRDAMLYRLAPFDADINFKTQNGVRIITMEGKIDYSGPLPGGVTAGLKTGGTMKAHMTDTGTDLYYAPSSFPRIAIDKWDTQTGWIAHNLAFDLDGTDRLMRKNDDGLLIVADLKDMSFDLRNPEDGHALHFNMTTLSAKGEIGKDQYWQLNAADTHMTSDTLPGPGTNIFADYGALTLQRVEGKAIEFDLTSPNVKAETRAIQANNMSVSISGTPDNFILDYDKGTARFPTNELPELPVTGQAVYTGGVWRGNAKTFLPKAPETPVDILYTFQDGIAEADVLINELFFTPKGLQPQTLISALRGKIADVSGRAEAKFFIRYEPGMPLISHGSASLVDMGMGTLPGPLSGMNTQLEFSSLFPLKTRGRQHMALDNFDPGIPLADGEIEFEIIPDGAKIYSAQWPLGNGAISLDPLIWRYSAKENRVTMRIIDVALGEFIKTLGAGKLDATGNITGVFPIVMRGIDVRVEGGRIDVKNGGVIRYKGPRSPNLPQQDKNREIVQEAVNLFRQISKDKDIADGNTTDGSVQISDLAFDALREFKYDKLWAAVDGPLDGSIDIGLVFNGYNKQVLGGQPFTFDVTLQGELLNILRSFNQSQYIDQAISENRLSRRAAQLP